jgi:hypothetical protein
MIAELIAGSKRTAAGVALPARVAAGRRTWP